jgi:hypothetical protein
MMNRTPAQTFGMTFGVLYLLVGLLGFLVTGFSNFAQDTNTQLIIFDVNPLHNIVHLLIGAALLGGARTHDSAKTMNTVVGVAYLGVAVIGIFGVLEFLAIDRGLVPDFWLHLLSGILGVYFGTAGAENRRTATG